MTTLMRKLYDRSDATLTETAALRPGAARGKSWPALAPDREKTSTRAHKSRHRSWQGQHLSVLDREGHVSIPGKARTCLVYHLRRNIRGQHEPAGTDHVECPFGGNTRPCRNIEERDGQVRVSRH